MADDIVVEEYQKKKDHIQRQEIRGLGRLIMCNNLIEPTRIPGELY